jgi:polyribonucleotide nucleotidyltransferase
MQKEIKEYQVSINDRLIKIETGKLAGQAGGSVTLTLGDTMVLATATMSANLRLGIDFFPLTIDYEERMYAGGRIPGSFFRREGRPNEEAILIDRLTDRPLRPLFPKDLRNDVQVILYALSTDGENPIDVLAVNAASAALMISDIPWGGPVGTVRVGHVDDEFIVNPTFGQLDKSDINLRLAGTRDGILMVECNAQEVPEELLIAALETGHRAIQPLIDLQLQMAAEIGKQKREYESFVVEDSLVSTIYERISVPVHQMMDEPYEAQKRYRAIDGLRDAVAEELAGEDETQIASVNSAFNSAFKQIVRKRLLERGLRPDGRSADQIRSIWCEVNISPRAHGSGLFTRGETQVLTLATLGTPREAQEIDSLSPADTKRYIHHYNFPPFSTGEAKFLRGASRRDIGHGALAERALLPVIPPETEFPYTLRLVSEVLSSNGSTSMASVCASSLALMDTGVPIKAPVAGIAMGLIKENDQYVILTDILGMEDHL